MEGSVKLYRFDESAKLERVEVKTGAGIKALALNTNTTLLRIASVAQDGRMKIEQVFQDWLMELGSLV